MRIISTKLLGLSSFVTNAALIANGAGAFSCAKAQRASAGMSDARKSGFIDLNDFEVLK